MKKRMIFGIIATVLCAALLAACGNSAPANNAPAQGGAEQVAPQEPAAAQDTPDALPADPAVPDQQAVPQQPAGGATATISEQEALNIALQHAGVSETELTYKNIHQEYEDDYGKQIYDINFRVGMMEYDYDVDAANGSILSYESEYDND